MRIVHTADWHLGSARSRIDPESGLNARLMDFARCARFTVEHGIARGAELILHAGDVFHSPRPTPTERRLALEAFGPALVAGIPVIAITGNHDMPRSPSEKHALDTLRDIPGLTIVDRPCILEAWRLRAGHLRVTLPASPEERATGDTTELQIACLPWPNRSLLLRDDDVRKLEPGQVNLLMRERMMDVARDLAQQCRPDVPSVLLAHCSLDVAAAGVNDRLMMLGSDWTLPATDVGSLGFDAVLLGHIHKPQRIEHGGESPIWYSGSPEACTFSEEGEAKGFGLLNIENDRLSYETIETPYRPFLSISPQDGEVDPEEVAGAIVRIRVPEAQAADIPEIRRGLEVAGALEISIEIERAEAERRAGALEVSAGMELEPALRTWIAQRPELGPLADDLVAEGLAIDRAMQGGAE